MLEEEDVFEALRYFIRLESALGGESLVIRRDEEASDIFLYEFAVAGQAADQLASLDGRHLIRLYPFRVPIDVREGDSLREVLEEIDELDSWERTHLVKLIVPRSTIAATRSCLEAALDILY